MADIPSILPVSIATESTNVGSQGAGSGDVAKAVAALLERFSSQPGEDDGKALAENLPLWRDLAVFEASLAAYLPTNSNVAANAVRNNPSPSPSEALPILLQRVLQQNDGLEFLIRELRGLPPEALKILTHALAGMSTPTDSDSQKAFVEMLHGFRRALSRLEQESPIPRGAQSGDMTRELTSYLRPAPGSNLFLGRGIVVERAEIPETESKSGVPAAAPWFRYRIEMGGATVEADSTEWRETGTFNTFHLERDQGRLLLRFRDPQFALPPELRSEFQTADAAGQSALSLAAEYVQPESSQPGSIAATRDLAKLLVDTGRLQGKNPSLPSPDELETLFRLMLAFPRDARAPTTQAHVWNEVAAHPDAFAPFLRLLRPQEERSASSDSPLLALETPTPSANPALRAALTQALQRLQTDPRLEALGDLVLPPAASDAKASAPERFLLQALTGLGTREKEWSEGHDRVFYYYHQDEWRDVEARWTRLPEPKTKRKPVSGSPPVQLRISTATPNLGAVEIALSLDQRGSRLDFRNETHDARQLLSESLSPLKQLLQELDLRLVDWTYAPLQTVKAKANKPAPSKPGVGSGPKGLVDLIG